MQKLFGILAIGLTLFVGNTASAAPLACCTGTIVCAGWDKCVDCPRGTRATNGTTASGYQFSHCAVLFETGPTTTKSTQAFTTEDDADAAVPTESAADDGVASEDEDSKGASTATCSATGTFGAGSAASLFALVPVLAGLMRRRRRH